MKSIEVKITASYRGYKIAYHESSKAWSVAIGKEINAYDNEDLEKVKSYVDNFLKSDFKPFEALTRRTGWGSDETFKKVTVTSVEVEGDGVWIRTEQGSRSKINKTDLVAITSENEAAIKEIQRLETEYDRLGKEKERAEKKLTQPDLK